MLESQLLGIRYDSHSGRSLTKSCTRWPHGQKLIYLASVSGSPTTGVNSSFLRAFAILNQLEGVEQLYEPTPGAVGNNRPLVIFLHSLCSTINLHNFRGRTSFLLNGRHLVTGISFKNAFECMSLPVFSFTSMYVSFGSLFRFFFFLISVFCPNALPLQELQAPANIFVFFRFHFPTSNTTSQIICNKT